MYAKEKAIEIITGLKRKWEEEHDYDGSEHPFWKDFRNWLSGYWDDDPYWREGSDATEVYWYWHEGFKKCYWARLSWKKFQANRGGMYREVPYSGVVLAFLFFGLRFIFSCVWVRLLL